MSRKRGVASQSKRRAPTRTPPNWSSRIFLAARQAAKDYAAESSGWDESLARLEQLIAQSLDTGTDKHVVRAMEDLEEAALGEAVNTVMICAEDAAASIPIQMQTPEGKEPGELQLFLVPTLLVMEPNLRVPQSLPDAAKAETRSPLDICATSLRRYGLIGPDPSVVLLPWLYAYSDLPGTWAGQRRMLRHLMDIANGQDAPIVRPKPTEAESRLMMALRFLVFGVFSANDADAGPLLDDELVVASADEADEAVDPRLLAWQEDLALTLAENLPGVLSARIGTPASWDNATHEGFQMRNLAGLMATVAPDDHPQVLQTTHAAMGLYLVDEDLELRIGISRDEQFINGFRWACHQDPETEIHEAFDALQQIGIPGAQIHVAGEVLGDERCPDCGAPYFPGATGQSGHEDAAMAGIIPEHHRLH